MSYELLIQNGNTVYSPCIEDSITWDTDRKGVPGKLNFEVIKDNVIYFEEGDAVRFREGEDEIFYGFIFSKKRSKDGKISVTAYNQLRYLKNKDTYVYTNKTASEVTKMIANDFQLNIGTIEDTKYKIPSRVEDNQTLFDIIQNSLDLTMQNYKELYVLYDNFGKLSLENISNLKIPILIDEQTGENFDYTSSIDEQTYNKIKLIYENEETGKREVYISQDSNNINQWGILQYFEKSDDNTNIQAKANSLLELYNKKTRKLQIKNALGDNRVQAGCLVAVQLNLGDIKVQNFMLVEKAKHIYKNQEHFMDLTLKGGDFIT